MSKIFSGPRLQTVRNQMMVGQRPKQCQTCYDVESKASTSYRQLALLKYQDILDYERIDDPQITSIDLMPSTVCNFSCRICSSHTSSKIASEELRYQKDPQKKQKLLTYIRTSSSAQNRNRVLHQLRLLPNLKHLHVMGGEPFVWQDLEPLVDHYIDQGLSSDMVLEFNTNGSIFPKTLLTKIETNYKGAEILLSIDNVGKKFELERGGAWDQVYQNLRNFAKVKSPKIKIKLAVTVNIQNVLDLADLICLSDDLGLDGIVWWYLESPDFLSIDHMTQTMKKLVHERYSGHACVELQNIATRVTMTKPISQHDFLQYMTELDRRRGQRFADTHPELFEAMGSCDLDKHVVSLTNE